MSYKYLFKYIIIGDSSVGKSCLLLKFTDGRFRHMHDLTIGVEFGSKQIEIDGDPVHLQVWDTAGQENFRSITRAYYKGANAALLVFDVTKRSSFASLEEWLNEIRENANYNIVTVLVGNKIDLEREVTSAEGKLFADAHDLMYMETSALTGENVDEVFQMAAKEVLSQVRDNPPPANEKGIRVDEGVEPKTDGCCSK